MRGFFIVYYCKYIQFNVSGIRLKYTRIDFFLKLYYMWISFK